MGDILITTLYRVPSRDNNISKVTWSNLFTSIFNLNENNVIIAGDFNCHHSLWGSATNCHNGSELCDSLGSVDLICLNNGSPTYRHRPNNKLSMLDLTFLSPRLFTSTTWKVWDDNLGSDHFPVISTIGADVPISHYKSHKYNLKNISWPIFSDTVSKFVEENDNRLTSNDSNTIESYDLFVHGLDEAVKASTPQPKNNPNDLNNHRSTNKNRKKSSFQHLGGTMLVTMRLPIAEEP